MKRVERHGTLESQQRQQQQQQLPYASHPNLPLSQGSDRFIHRSDTVLTQPPLNPYSLQSQPRVRSCGTRPSSLRQSNIRSSLPVCGSSLKSSLYKAQFIHTNIKPAPFYRCFKGRSR